MVSISPSNYIIENNYNQHFYKFNLKITEIQEPRERFFFNALLRKIKVLRNKVQVQNIWTASTGVLLTIAITVYLYSFNTFIAYYLITYITYIINCLKFVSSALIFIVIIFYYITLYFFYIINIIILNLYQKFINPLKLFIYLILQTTNYMSKK